MTTATGPRIQSGKRVQHRNSLHPTLALCSCCKPHARHHFDEDLMCRCGVSHEEHQADPQRCMAPPIVRDGAKCTRGHPKTEEFGKWYMHRTDGKWKWNCKPCAQRRLMERRKRAR